MKNPTKAKRNAQDEQITLILAALEQGVAPWAKPWQSLGHQKNARTGRLYNGGNALYLANVAANQGYEFPLWVTAKQAHDLGGRVKGEVKELVKGKLTVTQEDEWNNSWAVQWFRPYEAAKKDKTGNTILDENGDPETKLFWRRGVQFIYNIEQTTVPYKKFKKHLPKTKNEHERNIEIEKFLDNAQKGCGFGLEYGGDKAFYRPLTDTIKVPPAKYYKVIEEFYATNIHEYAHATGHKSRLSRGLNTQFGSEAYAEEELVAELTAAFIGAKFQIDGKCQHKEYLGSWFKVLKKNRQLFHQAASKAKKAADYLEKAAQSAERATKRKAEKEAA